MLTCLKINKASSSEEAWEELLEAGFEPLYSVESTEIGELNEIFINTPLVMVNLLNKCKTIAFIGETIPNETNWEDQWAAYAPNYKDGHLEINLSEFGEEGTIFLEAGGGFGDLSHQTTNLMLQLMVHNLKNKHVIDVGCGSGILSLCAMKMGAKSVVGIDIDPLAVTHSLSNAKKNGLNCLFVEPAQVNLSYLKESDHGAIGLMNMIWTEQKVAYSALKEKHAINEWITSGILLEERESYINYCAELGWCLIKESSKDDWCAFYFRRNTL